MKPSSLPREPRECRNGSWARSAFVDTNPNLRAQCLYAAARDFGRMASSEP